MITKTWRPAPLHCLTLLLAACTGAGGASPDAAGPDQIIGAPAPDGAIAPGVDAGIDQQPGDAALANGDGALPGGDGGAEGSPGQFDPDLCAPYTAHFLNGTGQAHKCTGVYYGGQSNLGQCLNGTCYNEMEVMLPTTFVKGTRVPAIIYIHGGGWATGSYVEGDAAQEADYLSRGFAVISLNYRLSPQNTNGLGLDPAKSDPNFFVTMKSGRYDGPNPYATNLADVKTAIQYVRSNMGDTIDGDNLVAMGHSAGAHLAILLGVTGSSTNSSSDPNLRGRNGSWSTMVRAVIAKDPPLDFGLFVGAKDQLPICGELLTPANMAANWCGYVTHPTPPAAWDSTTLGTGLDDLCVDKNGPGDQYQFNTYGSNYFDESGPWSTTMMGGDPEVVSPTQSANYFQWLVTPKSYLGSTSAPIYIINGVCDAEVPARGARDLATYAAGTLGLGANAFTVLLPQGAGHNDALKESINPGGNQAVRQWLSDNGVAVRVTP